MAQSLQLWGAPSVVKAFNAWRSATTENATEGEVPFSVLLAYEDLLLATRADLGVSNDGLERGDLLRIFINDLDEHLQPAADEDCRLRSEVEDAVREAHPVREVNQGDADWRVYGVRSDGRRFAVVYDNPVRADPGAARVVSAWPLRGNNRR